MAKDLLANHEVSNDEIANQGYTPEEIAEMEAYEKQVAVDKQQEQDKIWDEIYSQKEIPDEEINEYNNTFADYDEDINKGRVQGIHDAEIAGDSEEAGHPSIGGNGDSNGISGDVPGSPGLGERPSAEPTALTDTQQREVDRINTLYDESIKDAKTRLQNAKIERSKKEAFLESRNGLFGDTKTDESQQDKLFAGTFLYSQDTKKAALALFDKRINDIEKEIQDLEAERNADIKDVLSQVEMPINEPVQIAPDEVNTTPTPAQQAAGNYKKAHIKVQGLDIAIENPTGTERTGVDPDGKP